MITNNIRFESINFIYFDDDDDGGTVEQPKK